MWITGQYSGCLEHNYNKTYAANSGGAATYSHSVLDRINDHMAQMQAVVSRGSYISGHNLSFFGFFFFELPPNTQ